MATALKIEKNIPIPPARIGNGGRHKDRPNRVNWRLLEIGDSVLIPTADPTRVACDANSGARGAGIKVITRRVEGGIRVWRTA